jgi:glycosyltransferase involved in cell wall biosynthesis
MNTPLRVTVLTPLGEGGQGGIDRLMDSLRPELGGQAGGPVVADFVATRGFSLWVMPLAFVRALLVVLWRGLAGRHDVVHVNLASYGSTWRKLALVAVARMTRTPYMIHLHGGLFDKFAASRGPALRRAIRWMFEGAARVVVLGSHWRDVIAGLAPAAAGRIEIVPNGSAPPASLPVHDGAGTRILFLGRLEPLKGVPELIDALGSLAGRAGWTAVLAGNGAVEETRAALAAYGLADRVSVPGWLDAAGTAAALANADLLVLPSRVENLPMAVIEGFAHAIPAVATAVGSVPDLVVPGETGWLVPVGDAQALAVALGEAIADPAGRRRLGAAAQRLHAERLTLSAFRQRLTGLWAAAAQTGKMVTRVDRTSPGPSRPVATIMVASSRTEKAGE